MEENNLHIPTFLALLRASLWGEDFSPAPDTDWNEIRKELNHHTLRNLPVDILAKVDPQNQMLTIQRAAKDYTYWYALMQVQQDIMQILEAAGIRCATLKGSAADCYYPQPLNRCMGDIDILVPPSMVEQAMALLAEKGCTITDTRNPRHAELMKDGIHIELHRHFAVLSDANRAARLDRMLFDALDRAEKKSIEGYEFYMLPKLENGLVLMEHINSHMPSGLGLRQIIDWMLYVDRELDDEAWFGGFQEAIQSVGLEKLAVTVTRMCQIYLGLRNDITWCQVADEKLCNRLMGHTLKQGNFGRKLDKRVHGTIGVLNVLDSDLNFFQLLQRHGCYNWKALQKYPWLKPFAWLYQLCRYIRKGLRGKKPIASFLQAFRKKSENSNLLSELGVQKKDHVLQYDE